METTEAFEVLGLPASATEEEIEGRFRALAQEWHPDVGGSHEAMQRLNLARDTARAASARARALIPADVVRDLVVATTTAFAIRTEITQELQAVSTRIKHTLTNRLRNYRSLSTLLGGISAAALFLGKDLPDMFLATVVTSPQVSQRFTLMAFFIGMYCAVGYWYFTTRIDRAERLAEELSAHLSNRSNYVTLLDRITKGADHWTPGDLEHYVTEWTKSAPDEYARWAAFARVAGSEDFSRLLLSKGRELDLLKRTEQVDGRRLIEHYSLSLGTVKT